MTDQAGDGGQYEYPMPKIDGVELVSDGPVKLTLVNTDYSFSQPIETQPTMASKVEAWSKSGVFGTIATSSTTVMTAVSGSYYPTPSPGLSWGELYEQQNRLKAQQWLEDQEEKQKQKAQARREQARQRRLERRKLRLGRHPKQPVARQPIDLGLEEPS